MKCEIIRTNCRNNYILKVEKYNDLTSMSPFPNNVVGGVEDGDMDAKR